MSESILTEEEINDLKKEHPQKKILRWIFLIVGGFLIAVGLFLLLFGVDLGVSIDDMNISFVIDILIIVLGMILASKYWIAPYYLRENSLTIKSIRDLREPVKNYTKFFSFSISRLLAAFLLIIVGFWNYTVFGIGVGHHETRYGNAFVLGGPSWFYFTGLPMLVIGFSLLLYVILSTFKGTFSESENFYFFYENRPLCPWLTEIPKKDIEAIRYQNTEIGPKPAWVILFIPFIVMQLQTGIPLFFNNPRAAPEFVLSWTFLFSSIIEIVVVIILVGFPQNYYEIASDMLLYEMWFSPLKLRNQPEMTNEIKEFFDVDIENNNNKSKEKEKIKKSRKKNKSEEESLFGKLSDTHFQLFDLVFGIFLVVSAIIMLTQMVLFGPLYWYIALMFGIILLIKALCLDFSKEGGVKYSFDEENSTFKYQRCFSYKFFNIKAMDVESIKIRKWFRRLDFFDIFGLGGMLIMLTLQQTEGWAIADTPGVITSNIISTIYMAVIFVFIFLYLCMPIDVIEFKTPTITYRIRVTTKKGDKSLLQKYLHNLKSFPKEIKKDMKKTFLLRVGIYLALIIGTLLFTIITLIGYFY
ncbi:MAG: hypothetical protein R6U96_19035 [Promethearchaeia archaeon]